MKRIRGAHRALRRLPEGDIPPGEGVDGLLEGFHGPRGDEKTPYRPLRGLIRAGAGRAGGVEGHLRGITGGARGPRKESWGLHRALRGLRGRKTPLHDPYGGATGHPRGGRGGSAGRRRGSSGVRSALSSPLRGVDEGGGASCRRPRVVTGADRGVCGPSRGLYGGSLRCNGGSGAALDLDRDPRGRLQGVDTPRRARPRRLRQGSGQRRVGHEASRRAPRSWSGGPSWRWSATGGVYRDLMKSESPGIAIPGSCHTPSRVSRRPSGSLQGVSGFHRGEDRVADPSRDSDGDAIEAIGGVVGATSPCREPYGGPPRSVRGRTTPRRGLNHPPRRATGDDRGSMGGEFTP